MLETVPGPRVGETWLCQIPFPPYPRDRETPLFRVTSGGDPAWADPWGNVVRDARVVPVRVFWHPDATALLGEEGSDGHG